MTGEKCWSNYLVLVKCLKILTRNLNVCSSVPRNLLFCSYLLLMPVCFLRVKKSDMMCHCLMHERCAVDRSYGSNLRKTKRQTSLAKFQTNHDSWQLKKKTEYMYVTTIFCGPGALCDIHWVRTLLCYRHDCCVTQVWYESKAECCVTALQRILHDPTDIWQEFCSVSAST